MFRLIHAQTGLGGIVIDDIDDGLPNKEVHRLGSTADPKSYPRDGYANSPKQPCYIPYANPANTAQPGYIDLNETDRVTRSAGNGKIAGHQSAGNISVVSLVASELDVPAITAATIDDPASGDVTIDGTTFLSVLPDVTSVTLAGDGVGSVTLTKAQIEAVSPGAVSAIEIIIDSTLIAGLQGGDKITVNSNSQASNTWSLAPEISAAEVDLPTAGDITIDGVGFASDVAANTSVHLFGAGVGDVTLTYAEIVAVSPGAVSDTQIIIDSTLVPSLAAGDEVTVTADGTTSAAFTVTT
jgi:Cu/Ag efflux protein CusF